LYAFAKLFRYMKSHLSLLSIRSVVFWGALIGVTGVYAQGTVFTYQGQLMNDGLPATGNYDFTFTLFGESQNGVPIGPVLTNLNIPVAVGLFSAPLDFGTVFNGSSNWLEIAVRSSGNGNFTTLQPRQPLTPVPYAIFSANASNAVTANVAATATSVPAAGIVGTISPNNLTGAVAWQSPSGTTIQAQPNIDYLVTNSMQVTITLPASSNIGDVIEVAGVGSGGWMLAQNAGESVLATFTPLVLPGDIIADWTAIASSADGTKLTATAANGGIWTSANSGTNWAETIAPTNAHWTSIASSSDGTKLAAVIAGGGIWTSGDSGTNWTQTIAPSNQWTSIASSSGGTKLAAAMEGSGIMPATGTIWISSNSGTNWTQTIAPTNQWTSIASSSDGTKLAAAASGGIWTSSDSGTNWAQANAPAGYGWVTIASSSDGTDLAVGPDIWISSDSGTNWTQAVVASGYYWGSIASSSDGTKLAAAANYAGDSGPPPSGISTSSDSGMHWAMISVATGLQWSCIASSSDGTKLAATVGGTGSAGGIWTFSNGITTTRTASASGSTTPGTRGFLVGSSGSILKLLYAGQGQFITLYQAGAISGH
jgi:hypothetical protein